MSLGVLVLFWLRLNLRTFSEKSAWLLRSAELEAVLQAADGAAQESSSLAAEGTPRRSSHIAHLADALEGKTIALEEARGQVRQQRVAAPSGDLDT